jgi:hypothetical protein
VNGEHHNTGCALVGDDACDEENEGFDGPSFVVRFSFFLLFPRFLEAFHFLYSFDHSIRTWCAARINGARVQAVAEVCGRRSNDRLARNNRGFPPRFFVTSSE